ncbi:hypothetical protein DUNSADRAFT_13682 [Dunaliella salina]|uniref:Uncharacterized protein n=1 Tax=Dunaliella salina TaxID=3046 RepID=A0ABQ7G8W4_DUNSA|nr:hypothetical protein DUNSADRAFT_13682 [Dunaliella salina]|eukprot:KAF5831034.1 hypothetical protein DUNSADRAFT_13682 [Dunaliella salina]
MGRGDTFLLCSLGEGTVEKGTVHDRKKAVPMRTSRSLRFEDEEEDPVEEDEFRSAADKRASIEKAREDHQRRRQELERQGPDSQGGRKKRRTSCTIGSPGKKSKRGPRVSPENKRTVRGTFVLVYAVACA